MPSTAALTSSLSELCVVSSLVEAGARFSLAGLCGVVIGLCPSSKTIDRAPNVETKP